MYIKKSDRLVAKSSKRNRAVLLTYSLAFRVLKKAPTHIDRKRKNVLDSPASEMSLGLIKLRKDFATGQRTYDGLQGRTGRNYSFAEDR